MPIYSVKDSCPKYFVCAHLNSAEKKLSWDDVLLPLNSCCQFQLSQVKLLQNALFHEIFLSHDIQVTYAIVIPQGIQHL